MSNHWRQKNLLIIGASFGIGEALCYNAAQQGANLILLARNKDKLSILQQQLQCQHPQLSINSIALDCCQTDAASTLTQQLQSLGNPTVDSAIILIGAYQPMNIDSFDLATAQQINNSNFTSLINLLPWIIQTAKQQTLRQLAITASLAGYFGMPNSMIYGASKAAAINLSESLCYELSRYGVSVKLINPGFVKTRLTDKNDFNMPSLVTPDFAAQYILKHLKHKRFEIRFPFVFSLGFKILQKLPSGIRHWLVKKALIKSKL